MPEPIAIEVLHVSWDDERALALRARMDVEMQRRYGSDEPEDREWSAAINRALAVDPASIVDTILLVIDGEAVAHASVRMLETPAGREWEVKRVVVDDAHRGRGLGRRVTSEIIATAMSHGAKRIILQSGDRQPEAVRLYTGLGFTPIPVYEPYVELMPQSLCFELLLS